MIKCVFAASVIAVAVPALCRTVALWPIQRDVIEGTDNLRSAVDPGDDLTLVGAKVVDSDIGWTLPPNSDGDAGLLFRCADSRVVSGTASGQQLYSAAAGRHLVTTNAFTIEGYIKINDIPAVSGSGVLFFSAEGAGSPYSLGVNLWRGKEDANGEKGNILTWRLAASNNESQLFDVPDWDSFTNSWHHFAVTHSWSANTSTYRFWWDGALTGETTRSRNITNDEKAGTAQSTYDLQFLSKVNGWHGLKATLDWIRISDKTLEPSEFLNAGGSGIAAPYTGSTVAYWPLERRADGTLDGSPAVGKTALSSGLYDCLDMAAGDPKPALSPYFEDAKGGDSGSWLAESDGGWWRIADLGQVLELTSDFSVTGYLKPLRRHASPPEDEYVFGTFDGSKGWALRFVKNGDAWRFVLNAADSGGTVVDDAVLGGDLSDWCDWKKVALSYVVATGEWKLSLGDETWGTAANARKSAASGATDFYFGGYTHGANFRGAYDAFTVSAAGAGVAQWPLDIAGGVNFDGTDTLGAYTYTTVREAAFQAIATDRNAAIAFPDPSAGYRGDASVNSGAAVLRDQDAYRKRTMLMTSDREVLAVLREDEGFTVECYLYRTHTNGGSDWEILMGASGNFSSSGYPTFWQLSYATAANPNPGFRLYDDNGYGVKKNDMQFPSGNTECLTLNKWQHLALTAHVDKTDGLARYELFLDGVSLGVVTASGKRGSNATAPVMFFLGGRPSDGRVFRGYVDGVRISRGVLDPSKFLCATVPAQEKEEVSPWTVAEWNPPPVSVASVGTRTDLDVPFTIEGDINGAAAAAGADTFAAGNYSQSLSCGWKLSLDRTGTVPRLKLVAHGAALSPIIATDFGFNASASLTESLPVVLQYDPFKGNGSWYLTVSGKLVGTEENLYPPGGVCIGCHVLRFADACATGRWRLSCGMLPAEEFLYQIPKGTVITIR